MQRIVVYASRRHIYRKLAVCLVLLLAGAVLLSLDLVPWLGWALVLVGGGYTLVQLRALGEEKERVVIDDSGIRDSSLPVGTIGWDEVQGASVQMIGSVAVVALKVRDPERFIRRLPAARQFIARKASEAELPGLYLTLVGTDADPAQIAEAIGQRLRASPSAPDQGLIPPRG
jgi:hypothetical protein